MDVRVRRIRSALEEKGSGYEYVHTVRDLGYRFEARSREAE
jgi:DNA-binding response OmpR family regulator